MRKTGEFDRCADRVGSISIGAVATAIAIAGGWPRPAAFGLWVILAARTVSPDDSIYPRQAQAPASQVRVAARGDNRAPAGNTNGVWACTCGLLKLSRYVKLASGLRAFFWRKHVGSDTWRDPKAKREREALEQRALEFCQAQLERFEHLAGGPESFPLDNTIEQIEKECPTSGYDKLIDELLQSLGFEKYSQPASCLRSALATCNLHLQNLKKREACELVIWGEVLPETVQEISFFEQEKQRGITEALEGCCQVNQQNVQPGYSYSIIRWCTLLSLFTAAIASLPKSSVIASGSTFASP